MNAISASVFSCLAAMAATFAPAPPAGAVQIAPGDGFATPTVVTDVSTTDLGGVVIYDQLTAFVTDQFIPANPVLGIPAQGGRIEGNVQSRVVRSDNTGNLVFSFRFRDLVFTDPVPGPKGSSENFIELISWSGFAGFFPLGAFVLDRSQSEGQDMLTSVDFVDTAAGLLQFFSFLTEPDGTTFFAVETTAQNFTTGRFLSFEHSVPGDGAASLLSTTVGGIAVPTTGTLPLPPAPVPLPGGLALLLSGLGMCWAMRYRSA
jgi:hypothetical protein